jgi:hypothetical protein
VFLLGILSLGQLSDFDLNLWDILKHFQTSFSFTKLLKIKLNLFKCFFFVLL